MPHYIVKKGDCLSSIAYEHGLSWEKIYNHPENEAFRRKRPDPSIIHPGDSLFVPDKETKTVACSTGQSHRFRVKNSAVKLRLRLIKANGQPRAGETYTIDIGGKKYTGTTDADGRIERRIPASAAMGMLSVGASRTEYALYFGHVDPIEETTGIQSRLNNLGFRCGSVDGVLGARTKAAIERFQRKHGLHVDGIPGPETLSKLREAHGS